MPSICTLASLTFPTKSSVLRPSSKVCLKFWGLVPWLCECPSAQVRSKNPVGRQMLPEMVNAHSATYPHVTLFSTSETNYLPWILLTVTSSTTTRFQSTSSSPILSWVLSPWKPIGRWSSRSTVSPASCCFSHLLSQSLDLVRKLGGHLLDHGFQSLIYPALSGLSSFDFLSRS